MKLLKFEQEFYKFWTSTLGAESTWIRPFYFYTTHTLNRNYLTSLDNNGIIKVALNPNRLPFKNLIQKKGGQMIEGFIGWARNLLTLKPITSISVLQIISLEAQYFALAFLITLPFFRWGKEDKYLYKLIRDQPYLKIVSILFFCVVLEDLLFRLVPWGLGKIFGTLLGSLIIFHIFWALGHSENSLPNGIFAGISGIFYLRLWLGNLGWIAFLTHFLYDLFLITIAFLSKERFE